MTDEPWNEPDITINQAFERMMSEMGEQHTYPSGYPSGTHWAVDAAWNILDTIKPGVIPDDVRAFLAGQIAGRLMKERPSLQPDRP